jgi:Uma2 family endonuclease
MSTPLLLSNRPRTMNSPSALPELRPGDHLDRETFHERYEAMPEGFKAELIGGVVIVPLSVSADHADDHGLVMVWLNLYRIATAGTRALDNATILLGPDSEPQPDGILLILPEYGGQSRVDGKFLAGPPELVVEVAYSSQAYDLHSKYRDYEKAGVREYVVLVLHQKRVEWFVSREGRFEPHPAGEGGVFRSVAFPGLWLDSSALFAGDPARFVETLQRGLATPEHAAFVQQLWARKGSTSPQ